ncbi:acyltransferase [Enterovibrio nigricans]|uniref:Acetyltransferase (Isoleucine patch superfamily) n=1 Tax=Enterovibrio nigricans DSM 22720 TaxID=1121868 RepID=A0A1T4UH52_9GAMM|nr:acyltransferase [Enterovibrio nigricans]PKF51306.1 acyltransferase [Enterovibrio nigricans]SKA52034.1 Acetyltransferase (isoleucine patch superfamily) [Enterovibrio nigricans DSM 22720]
MFNFLFRWRNKVRVSEDNHISLEKNVRIRQCGIQIKGKNNRLIIEEGVNLKGVHIEIDGDNCQIIIGRNCVIGEGCYLSSREKGTTLRIGDNCMFSRNVKLMTSDGHNICINSERINRAKDITVGNNVWLADSVTVLKGVHIGDGAIAGIQSVVTKDVPEISVVAGNPAKVVKKAVSWKRELTY